MKTGDRTRFFRAVRASVWGIAAVLAVSCGTQHEETGQASAALSVPWETVSPVAGSLEQTGIYRSGLIYDIDLLPGQYPLLATSVGGPFLGGFLSYIPRGDTLPTGRVRSIARYPADPNVALVATGGYGTSPQVGDDSSGFGVYRTTNLTTGATWTANPVLGSGLVWRVDRIRWGAGSIVFATSNLGVFRSTDAGATWEATPIVAPGYPSSPVHELATDAFDIVVDPDWPTWVYVLTGDGHVRLSTNSGTTFTSDIVPEAPYNAARVARGSRLAIPKSHPERVYLMVADTVGPGMFGIFHSRLFGNDWVADNTTACALNPNARCGAMAASPVASGVLLAGGIAPGRPCIGVHDTVTNVTTWTNIADPTMHEDTNGITFAANGTAYIGSDGDLASAPALENYPYLDIANWNNLANLGISTPNIMSMDVGASNPAYQYLANWDAGLWANQGTSYYHSSHGDVFDVAVDPALHTRAFSAVGPQGENRFASIDAGSTWFPFNGNLPTVNWAFMRPDGMGTVFTMANNLIYSTPAPTTTSAPTWKKFPTALTTPFSETIGGLTVNRPGVGVPLYMWAWHGNAAASDKLFMWDPALAVWRASGSEFGATRATSIASSPDGASVFAITTAGTLWRSLDHGRPGTWLSFGTIPSGSTPSPLSLLVDPLDPQRVFLATASGVYRSTSAGIWNFWRNGLPFSNGAGAHVAQLRSAVSSGTTYIYAGVVGRGLYRRAATAAD